MANLIAKPAEAALEASLTQRCGLSIECGRLKPTGSMPINLSTARSLLLASLAPADDALIVAKIAEVASVTARRRDSDEGADIAIAAFAARLRDYPGDVALKALHSWPDRSEFFPTWKELRDLIEPKRELRRAWLDDLDAIDRTLNTPRVAHDPEARARQAEAQAGERAEVSAGLRRLGNVLRLDAARAEQKKSALAARFREGA